MEGNSQEAPASIQKETKLTCHERAESSIPERNIETERNEVEMSEESRKAEQQYLYIG